jgi:pilus assembly protein CpaF
MFNIIYQDKSGRKKRLDFQGLNCVIGSDRKSDFYIKSKNVSKRHAEITYDIAKGCIISDRGSSSGTWVNSERIVSPVVINDYDEIVIGNVKLWVRSSNNDIAAAPQIETIENSTSESSTEILVPELPKQLPSVKLPQDELLQWGRTVHEHLIDQMDLRRKDVHRMSDEELRAETEELIDQIIVTLQGAIPIGLDVDRLKTNVLNEAVGLGPLEKFLEDESISEIMVNSFDQVFVERNGKLEKSDYGFSSDHAVLSVIERIITPIGRRIDESSPMVDARLKDGSRVNAVIPPLALKGPSLTIRKFSKKKLQFDDLVGFDSVNQSMVDFLRVCVECRKNIIVSGGTGSGKTTLLNVLSSFIPDSERIVTVEDAAELKLDQPNLVSLEAKPANVEGRGAVSIRELVKNTLRMRPDRIVVGECRGGEALDMLQAMNTGHDGSLTTAHANTPRDLVSRLEVMVLMSGMALPVTAIREQISSAVDIVVQQTRYPCGTRKISRITEVVGIESGTVQLQDIFEFKRYGYDQNGKVKGEFKPNGFIPTFYEELAEIGMSTDLSIFNDPEGTGSDRF